MSQRRKLTLEDFFSRIAASLRYHSPSPRLRVWGDNGLIVWRKRGLKAGVVVSPALGGAFVFLGRARVPVDAVTECIAILEAIFAGDIIEVKADGGSTDVWLARATAPGVHINRYDTGSSVEVPVIRSMGFRAWPSE